MKKTIQKNIFQILLLAVLITFAFWFALKDNMDGVIENLKHVSSICIILIIVMGILYYSLQGYLLFCIARKYQPSITFRDGLKNAYTAAFFNGVTPLGGGQVAQTYAFRKLHISYRDIASILWKDFFLYQSVVVGFAFFLLVTNIALSFSTFSAFIWLIYLGFLINASVIVILWTMSHFPKLYGKLSDVLVVLLHKLHLIKNKEATLEKWNAQVHYFSKEVKKLKEDGHLIIKGLIVNLIRQIIYYSIPFVIGLGLGLPLSFSDLWLILLLSCFIHMLNALTPLPGDTGWTETAFILIFSIAFKRVNASAIMILWRMATYYMAILIGGFTFIRIKMSKDTPLSNDKNATQ